MKPQGHSYIFVRKDLEGAKIAVQVGHACVEMTRQLLGAEDPHPRLVLIGIRSEPKLENIKDYLREHGVKFIEYRERFMDWQLTAVATEPIPEEKREPFGKFRLLQ